MKVACNASDSDADNLGVRKKKTGKAEVVKVPWSVQEKESVFKVLHQFIKEWKSVGKVECEKAKAQSDALVNRTWRQ